jgi:hypothetical protein
MSEDPLQSRVEGQFGMPLSPGGDRNEYQIGRSIADWNQRELSRQNETIPMDSGFPATPAAIPYSGPIGPLGGGTPAGMARVSRSILGFILLIVTLPYYYLTIPLWVCLYPVAAAVAAAAGSAAFTAIGGGPITPSGRLVMSGVVAFIVAWPATLFDQRFLARYNPYWVVRHVLRLALLGFYAYVLTLSRMTGGRVPTTRPQFSSLTWNVEAIIVAAGVVVVMHLFLTTTPWVRNAWHRFTARRPD